MSTQETTAPGPWSAFDEHGRCLDCDGWSAQHEGNGSTTWRPIKDASGQVIALVVAHSELHEDLDTKDTARLIEAAPTLRDELQRLRAENERLQADAKKAAARDAMFCNTIERGYLAMQAAWLEAEITTPANGIAWIHNTLWGPGLLPDADEARALGGAQAWFDRESAKLDKVDAAREAENNATEAAHG